MSETPLELDPETWLGEFYNRRVRKNQDILILVSDWHNRRGTGKTALSLRLAEAMDRDGGLTQEKVTLSPEKLTKAYVEQPLGSALVLDEAEHGLSKYEAGSASNKAIRKIVSMGRIEEKYVIFNLPASGVLDRDIRSLCDVWILVENRGQARVYSLGYNPHGEHATPKFRQNLAWGDVPSGHLKRIYDQLTEDKRAQLRGEGGEGYVRQKDVDEAIQRAEESAAMKRRDQLILEMAAAGMSHKEIAQLDSLPGRSRISQIISEHRESAKAD